MLNFERLGVRRGDTITIGEVSARITVPGALFLMGPGGAGKSSLLAGLAGASDVELLGVAELEDRALPDVARTAWVHQGIALDGEASAAAQLRQDHDVDPVLARQWLSEAGVAAADEFLGQPATSLPHGLRRFLAVRAALQPERALYLIDEPTAEMDEPLVVAIRARVAEIARRACVVMVTHNRRDCLEIGGSVALVAGGTLQEFAPAARFFGSPSTPAGRLYVETGNCALATNVEPQPPESGVWWLVPGLLCGMSRPGMAAETDEQCRYLVDNGVDLLVCAEESPTSSREIAAQGLRFHHVSIADMAAPNFSQAVDLCRLVEPVICSNRGIAVHCRGGLGRTGTLLALVLIWFGDSADVAMAKVRTARPFSIQSKAQSTFLTEFAERIGGWR